MNYYFGGQMDQRALTSIAVFVLVCAATGCDEREKAPSEPAVSTPLQFDWVYDPTCFTRNDHGTTIVQQHDCEKLDTSAGFDDQKGVFDVKFHNAAGLEGQEALAVFEYRYLDANSFGIEYRKGAFRTGTDTFDPPSFQMEFPEELAASEIVGFFIACDDDQNDVEDCYENATHAHAELRICIDNKSDGLYADAEARCDADVDENPPFNRLPTATVFRTTNVSKTSTSATWRFQGLRSDPDGETPAVLWHIKNASGAVVAMSTSLAFEATLTEEGVHTARIRAQDTAGGIDIDTKTFTVVFADPTPLSASIDGPAYVPMNEVCNWTANVTGGSPPYSYEWRVYSQVVSTSSSYSTNTGQIDFSISLDVTDANDDTDSDELIVDVTSSVQECFDLD